MTPFSLEAALAGASVVTRDGSSITQIAYFPSANVPLKIIYQVAGSIKSCGENGRIYDATDTHLDLFMANTKNTWHGAWHQILSEKFTGQLFKTEVELDERLNIFNTIGWHKFTIEIEE